MIRRLLNGMGRGASLIVTDRRWGATLSAAALGFGLFVGVAIGPGAAGTFATGPQALLEIPSFGGNEEGGGGEAETGGSAGSSTESGAPLASGGESSPLESFAPIAPLASGSESSEPLAGEEEPAEETKAPAAQEEEPEPETTALAGIVVHANPDAGSYTLAIKGGELVPVHARKLPRVGAKLSLEGLQLANGTFVEEGAPKRRGQATGASFRGVVTHLDPDPAAPGYTLSGRGASIFVHVRPDPSGAAVPLPPLGAYATVGVDIEKAQPTPTPTPTPTSTATPPVAEPALEPAPAPSCAPDPALPVPPPSATTLWQRELEAEETAPATYLDLSGVLTAICPEAAQLMISSDDVRESGAHLTLAIPPKLDVSKLKLGDSLLATANVGEAGALTLAGLASDEQRKGADDPKAAQGDLRR